MGRVILRLECFHDDIAARKRAQRGMTRATQRTINDRNAGAELRLAAMGGAQTHVAIVSGIERNGRLKREFLDGLKDYSEANSVGSRGVFKYYVLTEGPLYEIVDRAGYGKPQRRRYVHVKDGKIVSVPTEEALKCLM